MKQSDFSSRIKKIFIPLYDYHFFHGPSEISKVDDRFLGRKAIIERLKAILNNSIVKSGAYLITGYRGMGKSSFVSKALSELSSGHKPNILGERYVRIASVLFLIALALNLINGLGNFEVYFPWLVGVNTILGIISLIILVKSVVPSKEENRKEVEIQISVINDQYKIFKNLGSISGNQKFVISFFLRIINKCKPLFKIKTDLISEKRLWKVLQETFIVTLLNGIFFVCYSLMNLKLKTSFIVYFIFFVLLLITNIISLGGILNQWKKIKNKYLQKQKEKGNDDISIPKILISFVSLLFSEFRKKLKAYFAYSRRIYIKTNIGADDISELDILKSVTRNLHEHYLNFFKTSKRNLLWKLLKLALIIIFTSLVYHNDVVYRLNNTLKKSSNFVYYFPSQMEEILKSTDEEYSALIDNQLNNKDWNYSDYIKNIDQLFKTNYSEELLSAKVNEQIAGLTAKIDLVIYVSYKTLLEITPIVSSVQEKIFLKVHRTTFNDDSNNKLIVEEDTDINIRHLDYIFIFTLFFVWFLTKNFYRLKLINIATHGAAIRKITELNEMIDYQVSLKTGNSSSLGSGLFKIFQQKTKNKKIVDVKEIEQRFIDILDYIDHIPRHTQRPEFTFIFDELDKIEPKSFNTDEEDKVGEFVNTYFTPEGTRHRQQTILKLLSNLKYFLTTAKAKFIFIAGREMFDAALADVSDRNFFLGSIFNDVIYVRSFLSESLSKQDEDITTLTENYVCRYLFDETYIQKMIVDDNFSYSLRDYNKYLIETCPEEFDDESANNELEKKLRKCKREKIIQTLHHFINYLSHRSNGAPKKITTFFESYIESHGDGFFQNDDREELFYFKAKQTTLYLGFNFYSQYALSFINYLSNPLLISTNSNIKNYDDKLLVSASFLIDQLFKYHNHGFSWINIEQMPEMIDINKSPELSGFIKELIEFLSKTHLVQIINGLYEFKFPKRLSDEISFISKFSERSAAAFNFTLDESLAIKQYYQKEINILEQKYKNIFGGNKRDEFIYSIGMLYLNLGDTYFYDGQYQEATINYREATQFLSSVEISEIPISMLLLYIRAMLKLGLTFEYRKSYDSALLIYTEITKDIIKFRNIPLEDFNLNEGCFNGERKFFIDKSNRSCSCKEVDYLPNIVIYDKIDKNDVLLSEKEIFDPESLFVCNPDTFSPQKANLYTKFSLIEGVRLFIQPLIAKLQVIEKGNLGGISIIELNRITDEFQFITRFISYSEKYMLLADFWKKVGDILFFKNGDIENPGHRESNLKPYSARKYYFNSLNYLMKYYFKDERDFFNEQFEPIIYLTTIINCLKEKSYISRRTNSFSLLATILSSIGDVFYSLADEKDKIELSDWSALNGVFMSKNYDEKNESLESLGNKNNLINAILFYSVASIFFRKANNYYEYSYQILKVLKLIDQFLTYHSEIDEDKEKKFQGKKTDSKMKEFCDNLASLAIDGYYGAYESFPRNEIKKYQYIFDEIKHNSKSDYLEQYDGLISLRNLTINYEVATVGILRTKILAKWEKEKNKHYPKNYLIYLLKELLCEFNYGSYNTFSGIKNKINELRLKEYYIKEAFDLIDDRNYDDEQLIKCIYGLKSTFENGGELKKFLIHQAVWALTEVIRLSNMYGLSYSLNHSFLAETHSKLFNWIKYARNSEDENKKLNFTYLQNLMGKGNTFSVSVTYHCVRAMRHYYSAIETHNEGRAYKSVINDLYYFNDDFNDSTYHFNASVERYRINTNFVRRQLAELKEANEKSELYDVQHYRTVRIKEGKDYKQFDEKKQEPKNRGISFS